MLQEKNIPANENQDPSSPGAKDAVSNPNPRANENIRIREAEPEKKNPIEPSNKINSEITDGEDA